MKKILFVLFVFSPFYLFAQIKHYLFIGMDREQLKNNSAWKTDVFDGVQVAYSWRQLEYQQDKYDFSIIKKDLKRLKKYHKKLFIQLQDVSFSMQYNHAPPYLLKDTIYNGGANKQYRFNYKNELEHWELGWVTRRWDSTVQQRLHKLYAELGKQFDGIVEGINLEETAVEFGSGPLHPPGYSYKRYKDAWIENLMALKKVFPLSTVIAYANFMPGGFVPGQDTTLLRAIYQFARSANIGVGGPDMFPYRPEQMNNSYGLIRDSYKKVPTSLAVQDGNYEYINPHTSKKITAADLFEFVNNYLHLTYIFWGTEEPFFTKETIPFLQLLGKKRK